jgi:hypothetical protein
MEPEGFQSEAVQNERPSARDSTLREEVRTCRIERWRGYVTSSFFVLTDDGEIIESRRFRWRRAAPPAETQAARAAYDELVARLEREGWSLSEDDTPWFATTFARTVLVPVQAPPEPERVPTPVASVPLQGLEPREEQTAVSEQVAEPEKERKSEPASETEPEVELLGRLGRLVATSKHEAEHDPEAEPKPGPSPAPAVVGPEPLHDPPRWRGPSSLLLGVPVAAVATVGTALAVHSASARTAAHRSKTPPPVTHVAQRQITEPVRQVAKAAPVATKPSAPSVVKVQFVAHGTGSWIEARRESKTGTLLYKGTLEPGKRLAFTAPRLWVELGAAGNLSITSDGKPTVLSGTVAKLFGPATG